MTTKEAQALIDAVLVTHAELGRALVELDQAAATHAKAAERVSDLEGKLRGLARKGATP